MNHHSQRDIRDRQWWTAEITEVCWKIRVLWIDYAEYRQRVSSYVSANTGALLGQRYGVGNVPSIAIGFEHEAYKIIYNIN